jgi:hypothetical protein
LNLDFVFWGCEANSKNYPHKNKNKDKRQFHKLIYSNILISWFLNYVRLCSIDWYWFQEAFFSSFQIFYCKNTWQIFLQNSKISWICTWNTELYPTHIYPKMTKFVRLNLKEMLFYHMTKVRKMASPFTFPLALPSIKGTPAPRASNFFQCLAICFVFFPMWVSCDISIYIWSIW